MIRASSSGDHLDCLFAGDAEGWVDVGGGRFEGGCGWGGSGGS